MQNTPALQPKTAERRPTPAVQYGNVCLPQARNKPLPPVPIEEVHEDGAYDPANDYKNISVPPEPDEDYLEVDIAYGSMTSDSVSGRHAAAESSSGANNSDEYNVSNSSEYSELPEYNEYNDFIVSASTVPLPPVPTAPPAQPAAPLSAPVSLNSSDINQDSKSNVLSPTTTSKTPQLLPPKSQVRRQAVLPPGLNTQRIKEVRQNLRPSLSNLPDFGLPPSPSVDASGGGCCGGLDDPSAMSLGARKKLFEATVGGTGGSRVVVVAGARTRIASTLSMEQSSVEDVLSSPPGPAAAPRQTTLLTNVDEQLDRESWFLGASTQQQCQERLISRGWTEGEFVVRRSRNPGHPFALLVVHDSEIFTLPVRRKQNGKYALGSQKAGESEFESVVSMIRHHQQQPILVVAGDTAGGRKSTGGQVLLQSEFRRIDSCSLGLIYDDVGVQTKINS